MAQKKTTSQRSGSRGKQSGNGSRPAQRRAPERTTTPTASTGATRAARRGSGGPPDVLLDVPELRVDLIHFELDDLDAHLASRRTC